MKDGAVSSSDVVISPTALDMLEAVEDRRIRRKLAERIDALMHDPEKQGKPFPGTWPDSVPFVPLDSVIGSYTM